MKILFLTLALTLLISGCGNQNSNKSGGSGSSSNLQVSSNMQQPSTVDSYIVTGSSSYIEIGGRSYTVYDQNSIGAINNALSIARQQNIQPQIVNGLYKFRARLTCYTSPGAGITSLVVMSAQIY